MKIGVWVVFFFFSLESFAYIIARTETGIPLQWNKDKRTIPLFINPLLVDKNIKLDKTPSEIDDLYDGSYSENLNRYLEERVSEIVLNSLGEWNEHSATKINPFISSNQSLERNNFYFTDNPNEFGAAVIAVTKLAYDPQSGDLLSGNILINQSANNLLTFTLSPKESSDDKAFLGDVITHEVGHFLGLSHSEVVESSMVYSVFKGQHKVHQDDIAGVKNIYNKSVDGSISGIVTSGGTPIFGAHVQVISARTNQVIQGQVTDDNGQFFFENLPLDEGYYLYTSPMKANSTLADFYKNVTADYCPQGKFYPSFFSKCGGRNKGRPQFIHLSEEDSFINIGEVTIRCSEFIDTEYLAKKLDSTNREYQLVRPTIDQNHFSFNGFFYPEEIAAGLSGQSDEFIIDFSHIDTSEIVESSYLNIRIAGSDLGSAIDLRNVYFKKITGSSWSSMAALVDSITQKTATTPVITIPLSKTTPSDNIFQLRIYPKELSEKEQFEIFSAPSTLLNTVNVYTITGYLSLDDGKPYEALSSYPYEDNSSCSEGNVVYKTNSYVSQESISNAAQFSDDSEVGITCGTIDVDGGGNNSGFGSMIFGLLLAILLFQLPFDSRKILS